MQYNAGDLPLSIINSIGGTTTYSRDGFGQLWSESSPDTGTTSLLYDAAGLLNTVNRANGISAAYAYDGLGRVTSVSAGGISQSYIYDNCTNGLGRICSTQGQNVTVWTQYEQNGSIRTRREYISGVFAPSDYTTSFYYDTLGRPSAIAYPNGVSVGYGYYYGRLSAMTVNVGGNVSNVITGATYKPFGSLASMSYGNGISRNYTIDLDGRTTSVSSSGVQSLGYSFDTANRITQISNAQNSSYSYGVGYDALDRVSSVSAPVGAQSFAYDLNGNRTSHGWSGFQDSYTRTIGNRIGSAGGRTFQHNAVGSRDMQSDATSTVNLTYDAFNRMSTFSRSNAASYLEPNYGTITYPGGLTRYGYTAAGQRVIKSGPQGTYRFTYASSDDVRVFSEHNDSNDGWTNYLWFGDELVGMVRAGNIYFVHGDHLGRPEAVTNSATNIVWRSNLLPFDRVPSLDTIQGLNIGLPGQYYDSESGFWYNINRYYDPRIGKYTQSDPIGLAGGSNTYNYAAANPISKIDPAGLDIAVIENGPTSGNPIGHTAIAITGHGVFSSGNGYPAGYDAVAYLAGEAGRRGTTVYVLKTTPAQDAAALAVLAANQQAVKIPKTFGNCSDRSNDALDAAKIKDTFTPNIWPGSAGARAAATGATSYQIPMGATSIPAALYQFSIGP